MRPEMKLTSGPLFKRALSKPHKCCNIPSITTSALSSRSCWFVYVLPKFHRPVIDFPEPIEMHREITIPGDPDSIPGARQELMEFLEQQGCPEDRAFEVGMAVQEALANAVLHGCKSNPELRVTMKVSSDRSGVSIIIQDPGPGFDVSQVPDPSSDETRTSSNGRG